MRPVDGDLAAGLRRAVGRVALLNLGYFGVEFTVALAIGSVALFADGVDFLEDALMLTRYRSHRGGLTRVAFLSARNDVLATSPSSPRG